MMFSEKPGVVDTEFSTQYWGKPNKLDQSSWYKENLVHKDLEVIIMIQNHEMNKNFVYSH